MDYEEIHGRDFTTFVVRYVPGVLSHPRWQSEPFDCFILDLGARTESKAIRAVALEIAANETGWVETFGPSAEAYHDAVDLASVEFGRQARVGDGVPMTAWHEELDSVDAILEYVRLGGHGSCWRKIILLVGPEADAVRIAEGIRASARGRG